jgi:hypothetical protein
VERDGEEPDPGATAQKRARPPALLGDPRARPWVLAGRSLRRRSARYRHGIITYDARPSTSKHDASPGIIEHEAGTTDPDVAHRLW